MRIGITGHQKLPPSGSWNWTRNEIHLFLERNIEIVTEVFSSLADGADQQFAEEALQLGIPLHVILPCSNYELAFGNPTALLMFTELKSQASEVRLLDYPEPSEDAFMAAGQEIVKSVDLLIAVWNGRSAPGNGGTDDVVKYAQLETRRIIHINPVSQTVSEI